MTIYFIISQTLSSIGNFAQSGNMEQWDYSIQILLVLSGIGILNSIFLAVYLLTLKTNNKTGNRILALLLFAISIKIGYAIVYYLTKDFALLRFIYLSLARSGNIAIGPLLFLYFKTLTDKPFVFNRVYYLHFIPVLLIIIISWTNVYFIIQGFWIIQLQLFIYIIISLVLLIKFYSLSKYERTQSEKNIFNWMISVLAGITIIWMAIVLLGIFKFIPFFIEIAVLYSFVIYVMVYLAIMLYRKNRQNIFIEKYKNYRITDDQAEKILEKLLSVMEKDKPYINPDLSISQLAHIISVPLHTLSMIINYKLQQNFSDFVNSYRIDEAKQMISSPEFQHIKISSIAYDSGFNTLSSFNTAFKKKTYLTPSQYRLQYSVDNK